MGLIRMDWFHPANPTWVAFVASLSAVIDLAPIREALSTPVVILPASSAPIFAEVIAASAIIPVWMNPIAIVPVLFRRELLMILFVWF
ncbi:hypothetical protein [Corynebacterium evansiae]|uniref:hypothetical protein n=1 Tax=Corynebacterium evansiae TaxID=2913499 RepID=UPI003EB8AE55